MIKRLKEIIYRRYNISFSVSGDDMFIKKLINNSKPGVYVDIGCWDPIKVSNSSYFSLRKWKGICIDPNPELITVYRKIRPNDIFINKVIGSSSGKKIKYYMLESHKSDMNTFDYDFLLKNGLADKIKNVVDIPIIRLDTLLSEYLSENDRIDFFDIDAEGCDLDVISTNDWNKYRPKVVIIESHSSLKNDLNSEVSKFLETKKYLLVGKTINHGDSGNLFFLDNNCK